MPAGVASIELTEALESDRSGTLVRFDAQVTWYPARPAADFLDADAVSSVTVRVTRPGARVRSFVRTIRSRPGIGRLVTLFNSLRGAAVASLCGEPDRPVYQLDVAMTGGRQLDVQASNCATDAITAPGNAWLLLWDPGNRLAALVASLIRPG